MYCVLKVYLEAEMSAAVSPAPFDRPARSSNRSNNLVFKSGPLYISSKGLGWKSWKRRWFILTRTSLVFFKNDPVSVHSLQLVLHIVFTSISVESLQPDWL